MIENVKGLKEIGLGAESYKSQVEIITVISKHINAISDQVEKMIEVRKKANEIENMHERSVAYCDEVKPFFDSIRYHADKFVLIVDDELWRLPKYREMLFLR